MPKRSASIPDAQTILAIRGFLARVSSEYPLSAAIPFGSRALGDFRVDSVADLAVLLRGPRGAFLDTKLMLADIF